MDAVVVPVDLGFFTNDTHILSNQCVDWHTYRLVLYDYKGHIITITFNNVLAFAFGYIPLLGVHPYYDTAIVNGSEWMAEQVRGFHANYSGDDISDVVHYRLCFNVDDEELNLICNKTVEVNREENWLKGPGDWHRAYCYWSAR